MFIMIHDTITHITAIFEFYFLKFLVNIEWPALVYSVQCIHCTVYSVYTVQCTLYICPNTGHLKFKASDTSLLIILNQ